MLRVLLFVLLSGAAAVSGVDLRADEWPQFRGPTGQGHSSEHDIPVDWSESRNVVWKTQVPGVGWSAYFMDTEQNVFGVMQFDSSAK